MCMAIHTLLGLDTALTIVSLQMPGDGSCRRRRSFDDGDRRRCDSRRRRKVGSRRGNDGRCRDQVVETRVA